MHNIDIKLHPWFYSVLTTNPVTKIYNYNFDIRHKCSGSEHSNFMLWNTI